MPQVYCPLCGAPILSHGSLKDKPTEWLTRAVLLTSAHMTKNGFIPDEYLPHGGLNSEIYYYERRTSSDDQSEETILRLKAYTETGHDDFHLSTSGTTVTVFLNNNTVGRPGTYIGGALYIPVHSLCLQVAERYIGSSKDAARDSGTIPPSGSITSIESLWNMLYRRLCGTVHSRSWCLDEPHDYYGGRLCRGVEYEGHDDTEYKQLLEANPTAEADLIDLITRNLTVLPAEIVEGGGFGKDAQDSKAEEDDSVAACNMQDIDLRCQYATSQARWLQLLVDRTTFPWLWPSSFDKTWIEQNIGTKTMDFELLVRKLSQTKIVEPSDGTLEISRELRNRRRIWRILETARIDDVADAAMKRRTARREEESKKPPVIPRPEWFDENGRPKGFGNKT